MTGQVRLQAKPEPILEQDAEFHVGGKHLRVSDDDGYQFPLLVMYPTDTPAEPIAFGPFNLDMAANAPPRAGTYPIVLISHGSGGTHLGYLELSRRLVRSGYVVCMPEHPGNNRSDNELADSPQILASRPRHLTLTLDLVLADESLSAVVNAAFVAVIGHSMGGYTALAMAGGQPSTQGGQAISVQGDARIKALVLLAPATPWFMGSGALSAVKVPILMLTGEHDPHTPPFHAEVVRNGLPKETRLEHIVVDNAGHFSFMSPFPAVMRNPEFLPGNDPDGFDRSSYQDVLSRDVAEFLASVPA
jgi:predicted dienelactone hydrolase